MIIRFQHPQFLALLLLLPLLPLLERRVRSRPAFLYSSVSLLRGIIDLPRPPGRRTLHLMRYTALALLITALARPQLGVGPILWESSGPTSVLTIDLAEPMGKASLTFGNELVSPLWMVKRAITRLIEGEGGGRIGLLGFADSVHLFCPPTADIDYFQRQLNRVEPCWGELGRALGDAIGSALGLTERAEGELRQIIAICGGTPTDGSIPLELALQAAHALGVKVHLILFTGANRQDESFVKAVQPLLERYGGTLQTAGSMVGLERAIGEVLIGKDQVFRKSRMRYQRYSELYAAVVVPALLLLLLEVYLGNTVWRRLP